MRFVRKSFGIQIGRDFYTGRYCYLMIGWHRGTDDVPGTRRFRHNIRWRIWPLLDLLWWQSAWYWRGRRFTLAWPCGIKISGRYRQWWPL